MDREFCKGSCVKALLKKEKFGSLKRLEPGFPVLRKAVAAVHRSSFGGLKGDFTLFTTV